MACSALINDLSITDPGSPAALQQLYDAGLGCVLTYAPNSSQCSQVCQQSNTNNLVTAECMACMSSVNTCSRIVSNANGTGTSTVACCPFLADAIGCSRLVSTNNGSLTQALSPPLRVSDYWWIFVVIGVLLVVLFSFWLLIRYRNHHFIISSHSFPVSMSLGR